jgi:hypothetical protein
MRQQLVDQQNMTTANVLIFKKIPVRQSEEDMTLLSSQTKQILSAKKISFCIV